MRSIAAIMSKNAQIPAHGEQNGTRGKKYETGLIS